MACRTRSRLAVLGAAIALVLPACGVARAGADRDVDVVALPAACRVVAPAVVQEALGVSASAVAGPLATAQGTCSWHSSDPTCFLRSLGMELQAGPSAAAGFDKARAGAYFADDLHGLGERAFYSVEPYHEGEAVQIAHLDVRQGETWLRVTLVGRLGPAAEDILLRVAEPAVAAGAAAS